MSRGRPTSVLLTADVVALAGRPAGSVLLIQRLAAFGREQAVEGADDAADARWFGLADLPPLAFDHATIIADAVRGARRWGAATPPPD